MVAATLLVVAAVLAIFAMPKFSSTREKASLAALKSDLRNLWAAQDAYAAANAGNYMPDGVATAGAPHKGFEPSKGVEVRITNAGSEWSATATAEGGEKPVCSIMVGKPTKENPGGARGPDC